MELRTERFQRQLLKLDVLEFIGVCRILDVKVLDEKEQPLPFETVFAALLSKYETLSRRKRRNLDRILRPIEKAKEKEQNGNSRE